MNRRRATTKRTAKGAVVDAPSEYGFVASDSPPPGPVAPRGDGESDGSASPGPLALVVAGSKLVLGLGLVTALSLMLAWGAHRYALTTPRFSIRTLAVTGNHHYNAGELARLAGVSLGQNLFAVDAHAAERKLLEDPWIEQARVGRGLPGTLRVDVVEREAAAVATLDDGLYLITPEGEPFKPVEAKDPTDLPYITGVNTRDLAVDRDRAVDRLAVGLEVVREYQSMPLSKVYEPEEVHLGSDGAVVLTIGKRGTALELGMGPFRQKLLMGARVIAKLQANGELPGIIFLDNAAHPERVVVRMR
ncbi:MAG TPA: FtsQ-type POTRA domain-containing protein [Polyangiaceae bacterium]|nr:FtsQ-type POTRA domain-containing protein [Polyangiaceae bacterium]